MTQSFEVQMTMTRVVTVVVEADDEADARAKANNLDYKYHVDGDVLRWSVISVVQSGDDEAAYRSGT